ncbi:MAG: leucine-rich repeat domain-containing protein [Promethearchaeota archaeon]
MFNNPIKKLKLIQFPDEIWVIKSLTEILEHNFGLNFMVSDGHVMEVQLIAAGLAVIPRQLKDLPFLHKLQIPSNHLKKLRNLEGCQELRYLNLHDNELPDEKLLPLTGLDHLINLDISQNNITSLEVFAKIPQLENLSVGDNKITEIPPISFPSLKKLDLRGNPIVLLRNLQYMELLQEIKLDVEMLPESEQTIYLEGIEAIQAYCASI